MKKWYFLIIFIFWFLSVSWVRAQEIASISLDDSSTSTTIPAVDDVKKPDIDLLNAIINPKTKLFALPYETALQKVIWIAVQEGLLPEDAVLWNSGQGAILYKYKEIKGTDWRLVHNGSDKIMALVAGSETNTTTTIWYVECFETKAAAIARAKEIDPNYSDEGTIEVE